MNTCQDPQHAFQCPTGFNLSYAYTTSVAAGHPVTANIRGVWYGTGENFRTSSIEVSKDWTTLVSGAASATTVLIPQGLLQGETVDEHALPPGKFRSAPPLLTARQFGTGRSSSPASRPWRCSTDRVCPPTRTSP